MTYSVTVTPVLHQHVPNSARLAVEDRLLLEASKPWVSCPTSLLLHHSGRNFEVRPYGGEILRYGQVWETSEVRLCVGQLLQRTLWDRLWSSSFGEI